MKLLLDENLSRRVVPFIQDSWPGSTQVALVGLEQTDDQTIWRYAQAHGYTIVTKDADFQELSVVHGAPPKVIWLRSGNLGKAALIRALVNNQASIDAALATAGCDCVEIR